MNESHYQSIMHLTCRFMI